MYSYDDIVWLKNVLNDQGSKWAYENVSFSEPFPLHWSDKQKSSAKRPEIGDIILLFQKPQIVNGGNNSRVYLTHLVTPVDDVEYRDLENVGFSYFRLVRLLAIANPITGIPNPGNLNFHKL